MKKEKLKKVKLEPNQKVSEFHDKKLELAVSELLSLFGGEDGGAGYYRLCMGLKHIEAQYLEGGDSSNSARQLIELFIRFHKLVKTLVE